jgi:DNA (cytosine-5)-methyltransferase 1
VKPRLLDLFCKAGGAAAGYARAGFDVVGVDIKPQPRYPFEFIQADALTFPLVGFDAFHASPPCQRHSQATAAGAWKNHPDLIPATRDRLAATGLPYVIENVPRAPLVNPLVLCGTMFGLTATDDDGTELHLKRHRLFESNVPLYARRWCDHPKGVQWAGSYGGARRDKVEARTVRHGGYVPSARVQGELLGIDWMRERELYEAIPPAYTEWVGRQLLAAVRS